jgi:hypothetical protein
LLRSLRSVLAEAIVDRRGPRSFLGAQSARREATCDGGLRGEYRYASFGAGMLEKSSHAVGADGYQRVLVLAPLPKGRGGVPSAAKDVQTP